MSKTESSIYPLDHLRTLPDGSLTATEVRLLCDEIERLSADLAVATKTLTGVLDIEELSWAWTVQGQLKIWVDGMKNYVDSGADEPVLRRLLDGDDIGSSQEDS